VSSHVGKNVIFYRRRVVNFLKSLLTMARSVAVKHSTFEMFDYVA